MASRTLSTSLTSKDSWRRTSPCPSSSSRTPATSSFGVLGRSTSMRSTSAMARPMHFSILDTTRLEASMLLLLRTSERISVVLMYNTVSDCHGRLAIGHGRFAPHTLGSAWYLISNPVSTCRPATNAGSQIRVMKLGKVFLRKYYSSFLFALPSIPARTSHLNASINAVLVVSQRGGGNLGILRLDIPSPSATSVIAGFWKYRCPLPIKLRPDGTISVMYSHHGPREANKRRRV